MAGTVAWGGVDSVVSYTDNWVQTSGIGLPLGRAAANGGRYARIYQLKAYARGRLASRSCVLSLSSGAVTSAFTIASAGSAADTGWRGCSDLVAGGTATFKIDCSGSFYFGRDSGGSSVDSYGSTFGQLYGAYSWTESPNQPTGLTATPDATTPGKVNLTWVTPTSNGGDAITGYRLEYSTDPTFGTGVSHVDLAVMNATSVLGLTPGVLYYFRIAAKNLVTTMASTWSVYSGSISVLARSGMRVWNGTAWVPASVRAWDGAAWVPAVIDVWDGDSWEAAQ